LNFPLFVVVGSEDLAFFGGISSEFPLSGLAVPDIKFKFPAGLKGTQFLESVSVGYGCSA
jgi:hypothetical protein